ncbi:MAG: precorrin-6y C5,15-methyltransferase (decarboxylating) subunit CbiE [Oscillatoria sp. SIO1A7]|nr:precorrin-6y C5,15-methyltransferase (decarboxylating) subunit CbiE [Oscillatoria sp. SIO1A7]
MKLALKKIRRQLESRQLEAEKETSRLETSELETSRLESGQLETSQLETTSSTLPSASPSTSSENPCIAPCIAILVSGDPLFFGLGRLLLAELPAEALTFHPHISSVQLAFNRIKVPWQSARTISVHGRSLDELIDALRKGENPIAVLTDSKNSPGAIARLLLSLDLPNAYEFWVGENLGGSTERVCCWRDLASVSKENFAPLNVVVLLRREEEESLDLESLPLLGLPDRSFLSFRDRPGLMTKREVRLLILGELALQPNQTIWDVGAGTGSVSIEIARLFPSSSIYAIEKTAAGISLIEGNAKRFQAGNIISIYGEAPDILYRLPSPDRIFIGGSGGKLERILNICSQQLSRRGTIVLAFSTLENIANLMAWAKQSGWQCRLLQVQLSRSVPIASMTRLEPLNPVAIVTLTR